MAFDYRQYS